MNILVFTEEDKTFNFDVHIDPYGNVYFDGTKYNNKYNIDPYFTTQQSLLFQLNVDRNNKLYGDTGNYEIIPNDSLINKKKLENNDTDEENSGDDEDYIVELDADGNEILCDDNPQFIFHCKNDDIQVNERENGDVASLYDTDIFDFNNALILRTTSGDDSSIYKLKVYLQGFVCFKCITCTENKYKLQINKLGELCFIVV